jgi:hypothetical protein
MTQGGVLQPVNEQRRDRGSVGFCETCAERGRPSEPVYKMGMCTFCFRGQPHPRATLEQVEQEKMESTRRRSTRSRASDGLLVLIRTDSAAWASQVSPVIPEDNSMPDEVEAFAGLFLAHYNHRS